VPASFVAARLEDDGCRAEYCLGSARMTCRAAVLVNAAGPWIPTVLSRIEPVPPSRPVDLVQGAHIVLRDRLDGGIYYVESPRDGRAVFVMPWRDRTLVGTTETPFAGDPDEVAALPQEQAYLVEVADHYFPRLRAKEPGAVIGSFAGLRVLPSGGGPFARRSRETILDTDRAGRARVITIYGGKLTTYRSTAQKVMERIRESLPRRQPVADTRELPLVAPH
jgi:glycerol-3-phosphate dehydrogenase